MAIDTVNEKLSTINMTLPWRMEIPTTSVSFTIGDLFHLLWQYNYEFIASGVRGIETNDIFDGAII